jgi:hypothetical protein
MKKLEEFIPRNRKSEIDFACREYVSTLINIGFNAQHLSEVCQDYFFNTSNVVSGSEYLEKFLTHLKPAQKKFSIFFDADSKVQELKAHFSEGFGVKVIRKIPKRISQIASTEGITLPVFKHKIVGFSEINALDKYSALASAQDRLNWVHDIYGLFRHRNSVELAKEAIVFDQQEERVSVLRTDSNPMHRISDYRREKANEKMEDMLVTLKLPRHSDRNRFLRVINFHGLATRTASAENQLINLWTALETITSSHSSGSSIVDTVAREIVPIICLNYSYRLFRSLTLDIVRWDRRRLSKSLNGCNLEENVDLVNKVLCLFAASENDERKEAFLASIDDFEIMRFRIFCLNKDFSDGRKILEKIERHERMVAWQIHRIYRARNQIVHSSRVGANIESLIVSAHDYFDQVFETTAKLCSGPSGFNTYDEAFKYSNLRYVEYKKSLKEIGRLNVAAVPKVLWQPRDIV